VVVVVVAGGASAWALTGGSNTNYRTSTAAIGAVEETLDSTGTLQTVNTARLSFQVAGQVASVAVSLGEPVTQGQVLASLDTSSLTSAVDSAQSSVTSAQQKLAADETSETSGTIISSATATPTARSNGSSQSGSGNSAIDAEQATLTADQHKTDADSAQAKADLNQAITLCASSASDGASGSGSSAGNGGTGSGNGSSNSGSGSQSGSTGGSGGDGGGSGTSRYTGTTPTPTNSASCTRALQQVLADQQTVSQDERTVAQDESVLAKTLSTSSDTADQPSSGSSSADPASSPSSASSIVVTPDQVAADQAMLDADQAQLSEAQTSLDEAQLTSSITGTVASVGVAVGQTVTANSSSDQIVVIAQQSFEVSATVGVTDVSEVKVGEKAYIALDGQSGQLVGEVTQVGPPPTSGTSTSYPVLVSLPAGSQNLYDGASASVSIVVGQASGVVTVPTSAVHQLGRFAYVSELRNGKLQNVTVTLGAMGGTLTQVSSGVKAGDAVVLADLSEPLPSTNSTTGRAGFAGVGALTGTGGFERGNFGRSSITSTGG
jgi:HlyD family secretion protein